MNYSIFIYETAEDFARRSDPAKRDAHFGAWMAYFDGLRAAGIIRGGSGLMPPDTATTVKLRSGQRLVEDGPYADTKEQLGGFFMIEVPDLDSALDWAAKCPGAASGVLEIRPNLPPMRPE
jgi:hypothetical protein